MTRISVRDLQAPLRARYQEEPEEAMVVDEAVTSGADPADPFHATVTPLPRCEASLPVGVHANLGGPHDAPTPGDILCGALAACQDSTFRMVANNLGVELTALSVEVTAHVDVRGTLMMDSSVPVGFQDMRCVVRFDVAEGTDPKRVEILQRAAESSCIVLQTLRSSPRIESVFERG